MTEPDPRMQELLDAPLGVIPTWPVEQQVNDVHAVLEVEWAELDTRRALAPLTGKPLTTDEEARYHDLSKLLKH